MPPTLLKQSATYQNPTGPDVHNKQALGAPVTAKVRFEQSYKVITTPTGEQQQIAGIVFMKASETIQNAAKVTYNGSAYRVVAISKPPGRNGAIDHLEVMVQNWNI